ncbi:putative cyclin-B3-1 [Taenia crassiceps]|uniref:Cyclin-B3-1 n=1 Tax=Taenia crassiceps TaxID=6207 RepID=A0ABR4Q403_9CEST
MEAVTPEPEQPEGQELEQQEADNKIVGTPLFLRGRDDIFVLHPEFFLRFISESVKSALITFITTYPIEQVLGERPIQFPIIIPPTELTASDFYGFKAIVLWERDSDESYIEAYNEFYPTLSGINVIFRLQLIEWIKRVHTWLNLQTRTLHVAVGLMDLYTWLRPILRQEYQLLALGALALAARFRSPDYSVIYFLFSGLSNCTWTQHQVLAMEILIRDTVGQRINFPTPHRFLDIYINGLTDFSSDKKKWARKACNYILDLGLNFADLCRHSAAIRCCAVLYLIRFILKRHCDCEDSDLGIGDSCPYADMPTWSEELLKFTALQNSPMLRNVASTYGTILLMIIDTCVPEYMAHHTPTTHSATFNRYVGLRYDMIAIDPILCGLTDDDLADILADE